MKNIQVIDDGVNATFGIFQTSDENFSEIFPEHGQDIHGTLYYGWEKRRKFLPKSKRECDRNPGDINQAQRDMYRRIG